jgi:DNA-binding NtrC family response regulator
MADILIIEDDEMVGLLIKAPLEEAGHTARLASNGKAGLRMIAQRPADLVITDIVMPEMDGLETISKLRESNPGLRVIAISGGGRWMPAESNLRLSGLMGASRTLQKPIPPDLLLTEVEAVLLEASQSKADAGEN